MPKALSLVLLLVLSISTPDASARSPQPRVEDGFIERIDRANRILQLRRSKKFESLLIVWNSLTSFFKNARSATPDELRVGTRVTISYHTPFVGKPFATKIVIRDSMGRGTQYGASMSPSFHRFYGSKVFR